MRKHLSSGTKICPCNLSHSSTLNLTTLSERNVSSLGQTALGNLDLCDVLMITMTNAAARVFHVPRTNVHGRSIVPDKNFLCGEIIVMQERVGSISHAPFLAICICSAEARAVRLLEDR